MKRAKGAGSRPGRDSSGRRASVSDTAFKVFANVCLRAELASGWLEFERAGLARELGKSRSTLGRCLRELAGKGVCELEAAPNQHRVSCLRVRPQYWPYEAREEEPVRQPARDGPGTDGGGATTYLSEVRRLFCQPACVQGPFGPADERLLTNWHRAGMPLETVRRAILMGSVRKAMSLLDRLDGEPIRSLRYFATPLAETRTESFPASYWRHLEFNPAPLRAGVAGPASRSRRRCPSRFGIGKPVQKGMGALIRDRGGGQGGDRMMMPWL